MLNHIMLDLETMGTAPGAAIVSIGAVKFDPWDATDTYESMIAPLTHRTFYKKVSLESNVKHGLHMSAGTVTWWLKQSEPARKELYGEVGLDVPTALKQFVLFAQSCNSKDVFLWGNGANFDNVLLEEAFRKCDIPNPIRYPNNMCYRTMATLGLVDTKTFKRYGDHHNAVHDAASQALFLQRIYNRLREMQSP